jgi:NADH dehydrogenase FAD-containing subunit
VAAGDAATPAALPGVPIRMACATAMPLGTAAADSILAALRGQPAPPFRFRYVFQCISLGRKDGLVQFVHSDDSPRERIISGRAAAWFKESVCRYTTVSLAIERRRPGTYRWPRSAAAVAKQARQAHAGAGD